MRGGITLELDEDRAGRPAKAWILGGITVVALCLRVYGLSKESLWLDEVHALKFAAASLGKALTAEKTNPPLYYVLLHFWIKGFGTSEAGLRSLSILPGLAAVPLTYMLGARLYCERVGLVAALYTAVATFHIYYAQEARAFALLAALLLGSMLTMHVALHGSGKGPWPWLLYCLTTIGALYTHFYAVFFVAAENLLFLLWWRRSRPKLRAWVMTQTVALVAFFPWLLTMLQAAGEGGQVRRHLLLKLPQAMFSFLAGDTFIPLDEAAVQDISGTLMTHWYYLVAFAVGFGVLLVEAMRKAMYTMSSAVFCATLVLVPTMIAFIISFKVMLFDERYLIGVSPLLYIFVASSMARSRRGEDEAQRRPGSVVRVAASGLVLAVISVSLHHYYWHPRYGKEQWREAVAYVESNAQPGDVVTFDADFVEPCYEYYATRPITKLSASEARAWLYDRRDASEVGRMWLVRSHSRDRTVVNELQARLTRRETRVFPRANGIEVVLWTR
jgi:uncharacterized membrane protein